MDSQELLTAGGSAGVGVLVTLAIVRTNQARDRAEFLELRARVKAGEDREHSFHKEMRACLIRIEERLK